MSYAITIQADRDYNLVGSLELVRSALAACMPFHHVVLRTNGTIVFRGPALKAVI